MFQIWKLTPEETAMTVKERQVVTVQQLYSQLAEFIHSNMYSSDRSVRWLADELKNNALVIVAEVGNMKLSEENQAKVRNFHAAELQKQLEEKRREVDRLERDLKTVSA
jgi:aspartokinase-like uncharacterized kinase